MKLIRNLSFIVGLILLWAIGSQYSSPLFLPEPTKVIDSFVELMKNGMLPEAVRMSFMRITTASVISCGISIPLGLFVSEYKVLDETLTPLTNLMRYIPVTVFYPLLIMWLGIGEQMKITFLFVATFFFFLPSVILCVKEVNTDLVETAYTMGMNKFQVMFRVILPYSLPSICQSFLMMYGIGWTYIIIVEVVNAHAGLGHLINLGSARGRTDLVFAALLVIMTISWIFDFCGNKLIRWVFAWKFAREIED